MTSLIPSLRSVGATPTKRIFTKEGGSVISPICNGAVTRPLHLLTHSSQIEMSLWASCHLINSVRLSCRHGGKASHSFCMYPRDLKRGDSIYSVLRLLPSHQHSKRWNSRAWGAQCLFIFVDSSFVSSPFHEAGGWRRSQTQPHGAGPHTGRGVSTAGFGSVTGPAGFTFFLSSPAPLRGWLRGS